MPPVVRGRCGCSAFDCGEGFTGLQLRLVEPLQGEGLPRGTDLVGHGDQIAFDVARRLERHGEHVACDAVTFDRVEAEVTHYVAQCSLPVREPVQPMGAVIPVMPVIQEVIVQQSRADQRMQIDLVPQMQAVGHPHGEARHADRMRECRHRSMLVASALDMLHMIMDDDVVPMLVDQRPNLIARQHTVSLRPNPSSVCLCLFQS